MKIKITKTLQNIHLPTRKHHNDAGADVYSIATVKVYPQSTLTLDLGFSVEIPDGHMGLLMPRSSLAASGLPTVYTPIDSGYRGSLKIMLHNSTSQPIEIKEGDRVGQLVIVPIVIADFVESFDDGRDTGGFGSTGK